MVLLQLYAGMTTLTRGCSMLPYLRILTRRFSWLFIVRVGAWFVKLRNRPRGAASACPKSGFRRLFEEATSVNQGASEVHTVDRGFVSSLLLQALFLATAEGFAPAGATRGLSHRPLDFFGPHA